MSICLEKSCGKEFEQNGSKRPKLFCSGKCKQKNYRDKVILELNTLRSSVKEYAHIFTPEVVTGTDPSCNKIQKKYPALVKEKSASILEQIAAIEAEKIPEHRDTRLGRRSWQQEQENRIQELRGRL